MFFETPPRSQYSKIQQTVAFVTVITARYRVSLGGFYLCSTGVVLVLYFILRYKVRVIGTD